MIIAISRTEDYRHDVWDVTAGSAIGLVVAWLTFRRYYPKLRSRTCETPYPSRKELMQRKLGQGRKPDEESAGDGIRPVHRESLESEPEEEEARRELLRPPARTGDR